jgi:hypothetical protein
LADAAQDVVRGEWPQVISGGGDGAGMWASVFRGECQQRRSRQIEEAMLSYNDPY